jgi:rubredoxin
MSSPRDGQQFVCVDCQAWVYDAASFRVDAAEPRCFLCLWVRDEEPDDPEKRAELRALIDRE